MKVLTPVLADEKSSMEVVGITALACGMIAVGTTNQLVAENLVNTLLAKSETELKETYARFISLGLALTYLGKFSILFRMQYGTVGSDESVLFIYLPIGSTKKLQYLIVHSAVYVEVEWHVFLLQYTNVRDSVLCSYHCVKWHRFPVHNSTVQNLSAFFFFPDFRSRTHNATNVNIYCLMLLKYTNVYAVYPVSI